MKPNYFTLFSLFLLCSIQLHAQDITSNLIMDMSFSNEVEDLTTNATPVLSGMETYAEDRDGNAACALKFGGQPDEYVVVPGNTDNQLVDGDDATVSLWFRMDNTIGGDYEILFQKGNIDSPNYPSFDMAVYDGNTPLIGNILWDDDWNMDDDLWTDTTDWHHFVLVANTADQTVKLYRDNVLRNTGDINDFAWGPTVDDFRLGAGFKGFLDDLKVYRRALTAAEIDVLYTESGNCETLNVDEDSQDPIQLTRKNSNTYQFLNLPAEKQSLRIYNLSGKLVKEETTISLSNNTIDLNALSPELYILKVENKKAQRQQTFKVIIN